MPPGSAGRPGRKAYLLIALFALALVLLPFLFWYYTWFGRKLSDSELDEYFADTAHPRHAQHALVQIGERLSHNQDVTHWYPDVLLEAASPSPELRQTAAWIMGQDVRYAPFRPALVKLVTDPQPMVRRNAALSLAVFGDPAARPELIAMLQPFTIRAAAAGTLKYRLKVGDYVNPGTLVAHIGESEVRSQAPGEVRELSSPDGAQVHPGQPLAELGADPNHVWEALRALYLVGQTPDLDEVEDYLRPIPGMPKEVARQAALTAAAIQARH